MNAQTIEDLKKQGAIKALRDHIRALQFELTQHNWNDIDRNGRYMRMGAALEKASLIISNMKETLKALQELDPAQK